jgi:hypothetical protein
MTWQACPIRIFYLTLSRMSINIHSMKDRDDDNGEEGWEYGDVWKKGTPDETAGDEEVEYVEVLRGETGRGFDDSVMIDLVAYLGSRGIRATFDSYSSGLELGAIKTYVLKVESGKEEETMEYLNEKFKVQGS